MNHTQLHSTTAGKCSMSFCSIANGKHNKNTFMKNGKENKEYIISQRSLHFSLSIAISESNLVDESALRRANTLSGWIVAHSFSFLIRKSGFFMYSVVLITRQILEKNNECRVKNMFEL